MKTRIKKMIERLKQNIDIRKIIIVLSVFSALLQIIFGRTHNNAAYVVYGTVAIFSFFFVITLLIDVVNSLRVEMGLLNLIPTIFTKIISSFFGIIYIYKLVSDDNFSRAMAGELNNSSFVVYQIQSSVYLISISIIILIITAVLSVVGYVKHIKNANEN